MAQSIGQLVTIHMLQRNPEYNGCKGRILSWKADRWLVSVLMREGGERRLSLKPANLEYVDAEWQRVTGSSKGPFQQNAMIRYFGAPARCPPPLTELSLLSKPPSWSQLVAFWGEEVYSYMCDRLPFVIDGAAGSNKGRGLFWEFENCGRRAALAMVFSDGSKQMQDAPPGGNCSWSMFWPVLVPADSVTSSAHTPGNNAAITTWCQAQALSGSRPYRTHPDRIFIISMPVESIPAHVTTSTVTVEEMDDPDGDDGFILITTCDC